MSLGKNTLTRSATEVSYKRKENLVKDHLEVAYKGKEHFEKERHRRD
jgi:hypothetical protein